MGGPMPLKIPEPNFQPFAWNLPMKNPLPNMQYTGQIQNNQGMNTMQQGQNNNGAINNNQGAGLKPPWSK